MNWGIVMTDKKSGKNSGGDIFLEDLFATARQDQTELPPALHQRIMLDAERTMNMATPHKPRPVSMGDRVKAMLQSVGGWPAVTVMASAAVIGVLLGIDPPSLSWGQSSVVYSDTDLFLNDLFADLTYLSEDL